MTMALTLVMVMKTPKAKWLIPTSRVPNIDMKGTTNEYARPSKTHSSTMTNRPGVVTRARKARSKRDIGVWLYDTTASATSHDPGPLWRCSAFATHCDGQLSTLGLWGMSSYERGIDRAQEILRGARGLGESALAERSVEMDGADLHHSNPNDETRMSNK